jgi:eukaryotic-like serine/threonine-protein kinase
MRSLDRTAFSAQEREDKHWTLGLAQAAAGSSSPEANSCLRAKKGHQEEAAIRVDRFGRRGGETGLPWPARGVALTHRQRAPSLVGKPGRVEEDFVGRDLRFMPNRSFLHGALAEGTLFNGRYEISRCMKAGGMGAIYEVVDHVTRRRRALKTMLPDVVQDADLRERFRQEATVTAEVHSEHIVEVFDAGIDKATGVPFIVMELLRGDDLGAVLVAKGPFEPAAVVNLLYQVSLALERTHAVDIVHRDLKPENLFLVRRDSGAPHVKVLDFGIAKFVAQSTRPQTTGVIGTPLYMSPEQAAGDGAVGPAADLYAVAHIAFTLLTGNAFWEAVAQRSSSPAAVLVKVMQGAAQSASARAKELMIELPHGFDAWFAEATALSPVDRFATSRELIESLAEVFGLSLPGDSEAEHSPGRASSPGVTKRLGTPALAGAAGSEVPIAHHTGPAVSSNKRPLRRQRSTWLGVAGGVLVITVGGLGLVSLLKNRAVSGDAADPESSSGFSPSVPVRASSGLALQRDLTETNAARPLPVGASAVADAGLPKSAMSSSKPPAPKAGAPVSKAVALPPRPAAFASAGTPGAAGTPGIVTIESPPPKGAGTVQDPSDIW